ncbi:MAG: pentapeptide repeat-containing protein [Dehalococcoidales bacterium]|nr:MAG: pentapeptide repeat-containing protein [Dehalococcoidales bacterium]
MGDGTEQNPYTREDLLRLIEENGDKAEGLDLSGKWFKEGIDLRGLHLDNIILRYANLPKANFQEVSLSGANLQQADLTGANLQEADLMKANLQEAGLINANLRKASLVAANFQKATLFFVDLQQANLIGAKLQGIVLAGEEISSEIEIEHVDWGNYVLGNERSDLILVAQAVYRRLKQWYTNVGMYDVAGKFFYREMESKRKAHSWKKEPASKLSSWVMRLLCGYGERPFRVVGFATLAIVILAFIYFFTGSAWEWPAFWNSLYFSAVSFTALGYGSWVETTNGWIRGLGAFEAFIGVFSMALFLVTFTRKMTR